ncbi:unnamed protein product, partial [Mesorhabditis spiculigera]
MKRLPVPRLYAASLRHFSKKTPLPDDELLIPDSPVCSHVDDVGEVPTFDHKLITHLERLSLLRFSDEEAVANLREAVRTANRLKHVNVDGVEPMYRVHEDQECPLREDNEASALSREEALSNAAKTFEDYFVTPPGNLPLAAKEDLNLKLINEWDKLGQPNVPDPRKRKNAGATN